MGTGLTPMADAPQTTGNTRGLAHVRGRSEVLTDYRKEPKP